MFLHPKHYFFIYPIFSINFLTKIKDSEGFYLINPNSLWELFYFLLKKSFIFKVHQTVF
jgi:hypothetical protein